MFCCFSVSNLKFVNNSMVISEKSSTIMHGNKLYKSANSFLCTIGIEFTKITSQKR